MALGTDPTGPLAQEALAVIAAGGDLKAARRRFERHEWDAKAAQEVIDRHAPEPDGPGLCGVSRARAS